MKGRCCGQSVHGHIIYSPVCRELRRVGDLRNLPRKNYKDINRDLISETEKLESDDEVGQANGSPKGASGIAGKSPDKFALADSDGDTNYDEDLDEEMKKLNEEYLRLRKEQETLRKRTELKVMRKRLQQQRENVQTLRGTITIKPVSDKKPKGNRSKKTMVSREISPTPHMEFP